MIGNYIDEVKNFTKSTKEVLLATARIKYTFSVTNSSIPEQITTLVYGSRVSENPDLAEVQALNSQASIFSRTFPNTFPLREWDCTPGKLDILFFLKSITDEDLTKLKLFDSEPTPFFNITLLHSEKKLQFERITIKAFTNDLEKKFNISTFPWYSILQDNSEVISGIFDKCNISLLRNLFEQYSPFEAIGLYGLESPCSIVFYNNIKGVEKEIILKEGITVVEFWNNSCIEVFNEKVEGKCFKVHVGNEIIDNNCKYSLGLQGLSHLTAERLRIIDLPTTFVFNNGVVLWKGNRLMVDFDGMVQDIINDGKYLEKPGENEEEIVRKASKQLVKAKNEVFGEENEALIDLKVFVTVDVTAVKTCMKKISKVLVGHCKNDEEEAKFFELFNSIKGKIKNLKHQCIKSHQIFSTMLTEIPDNQDPVPPENPLKHKQYELHRKCQILKKNVLEITAKASAFEEKLLEKDQLIEKQLKSIHE